jgi:hypothetical protein
MTCKEAREATKPAGREFAMLHIIRRKGIEAVL